MNLEALEHVMRIWHDHAAAEKVFLVGLCKEARPCDYSQTDWGHFETRVMVTDLMDVTGLSQRHTYKVIHDLEARGVLEVERSETSTPGEPRNVYRF